MLQPTYLLVCDSHSIYTHLLQSSYVQVPVTVHIYFPHLDLNSKRKCTS